MRVLLILGVALLSGCGTLATLEELEYQAALTGDWSAVEQRERIIARRLARQGPSCSGGAVAVCENRTGENRCTCVSQEAVVDMFAGQY